MSDNQIPQLAPPYYLNRAALASLLDHQRAATDSLPLHSHTYIASAIASEITSAHSPLIIGLEGSFGSGKSTVVQLLQAKFPKHCHFYCYDLWQHQDDQLRRSLMEELTYSLLDRDPPLLAVPADPALLEPDGHQPIHPKQKLYAWMDAHHVAVERHTQSSIAVPRHVKLLLLGLCVVLLSVIADLSELFDAGAKGALILSFCVLAALLLFFAPDDSDLPLSAQEDDPLFSPRAWIDSIVRKLTLHSTRTQDQISEKHQKNDLTVSELRHWVAVLSKDLAATTPNSTIVLVIDNLDRLPESKIGEFFATCHELFVPQQGKADLECLIHLLVPYEYRHLDSFLQSDQERSHSKTVPGKDDHASTPNAPGSKEALSTAEAPGVPRHPDYAADLLRKTFDLTFRLADPDRGSWVEFFTRHLRLILPEISSSECHDCVELLRRSAGEDKITPRFMLSALKDLYTELSLRITLGEQTALPLRCLMLYSLKRRSFSTLSFADAYEAEVTPLMTPDFVFAKDNPEQILRAICAIHYQCLPDRALDDIIINTIRSELVSGDIKLTALYAPSAFFRANLEQFFTNSTATDDLKKKIFISFTKLIGMGQLEGLKPADWLRLFELALHSVGDSKLFPEHLNCFALILKHLVTGEVADTAFSKLIATFINNQVGPDNNSLSNWEDTVSQSINSLLLKRSLRALVQCAKSLPPGTQHTRPRIEIPLNLSINLYNALTNEEFRELTTQLYLEASFNLSMLYDQLILLSSEPTELVKFLSILKFLKNSPFPGNRYEDFIIHSLSLVRKYCNSTDSPTDQHGRELLSVLDLLIKFRHLHPFSFAEALSPISSTKVIHEVFPDLCCQKIIVASEQ